MQVTIFVKAAASGSTGASLQPLSLKSVKFARLVQTGHGISRTVSRKTEISSSLMVRLGYGVHFSPSGADRVGDSLDSDRDEPACSARLVQRILGPRKSLEHERPSGDVEMANASHEAKLA